MKIEKDLLIMSVTQPMEISSFANIIGEHRQIGTLRPCTISITGCSTGDRLDNMYFGLE
jgi:hypothetical protein